MPNGAKRWVFTIFSDDIEELETLLDNLNWGEFGGAQIERCPTTQRLHIQGFVCFSKRTSLAHLKSTLSRSAHWEVMRGTLDDSIVYCSKEESRYEGTIPKTWGEKPLEQGSRNDLILVSTFIKNLVGTVPSKARMVAEAYPVQWIKYHRGLMDLIRQTAVRIKTDPPLHWRTWQSDLLATLEEEPDNRTIHWFTDHVGGQGKSTMVTYCIDYKDAVMLNGKVSDMAHAYNSEPIAMFDVTRTQLEHMDHLYSFVESLKNGIIFSPKYDSGMKRFKPPHVVFFANKTYERGKWSADRVKEVILTEQDVFNHPDDPNLVE